MPRRAIPLYLASVALGVMDFTAARGSELDIQTGHRYRQMDMRLTVELAYDGSAPAAGLKQEGVLGLISDMNIKVNNGDARYSTNGQNILAQSHYQAGVEPYGFVAPNGGAAGTYEVSFQYRFHPTQLRERGQFALDLLKYTNDPNAVSYAKLGVKWGSISDIFETPNGMSVVSAQLEVMAIEEKLPHGQYRRSAELVTASTTFNTTVSGDVEHKIVRKPNEVLVGFTIIQTADGVAVPFSDESAIVRVRDSSSNVTYKEHTIWQINQQMTLERQVAVPNNMLYIPMTDSAALGTGLHDDSLDGELAVRVPATFTAGAAENKLTIIGEYARIPAI